MVPMEILKSVFSLSLFGMAAYAVGLILTEGDFQTSRFVVPRSRRGRYLIRAFSFLEFIISIGLVVAAILLNETLHSPSSRMLVYTSFSILVVKVIISFIDTQKIQFNNRKNRMESKIGNILIIGWFVFSLYLNKIAILNSERMLTFVMITYLFFFMVFLKATFTKTYINVVIEIQLKNGTELGTLNLLDETNDFFVIAAPEDANLLIPKSEVVKARVWLEQRPFNKTI